MYLKGKEKSDQKSPLKLAQKASERVFKKDALKVLFALIISIVWNNFCYSKGNLRSKFSDDRKWRSQGTF